MAAARRNLHHPSARRGGGGGGGGGEGWFAVRVGRLRRRDLPRQLHGALMHRHATWLVAIACLAGPACRVRPRSAEGLPRRHPQARSDEPDGQALERCEHRQPRCVVLVAEGAGGTVGCPALPALVNRSAAGRKAPKQLPAPRPRAAARPGGPCAPSRTNRRGHGRRPARCRRWRGPARCRADRRACSVSGWPRHLDGHWSL